MLFSRSLLRQVSHGTWGAWFSSVPAGAAASPPLASASRLEALRAQLASDAAAGTGAAPTLLASSASEASSMVRRASKREPKPKWLKAELPQGKNYERLKSTVRFNS